MSLLQSVHGKSSLGNIFLDCRKDLSKRRRTRAKNKEGPKLGVRVQLFRMKRCRNRASAPKSATWRPPSLCALNGLGVLCLGMCCRLLAISSRAPNGVSNEHFRSDHIF